MPSGENRGRASGSPLGHEEDRISAAHVLHSRCCLPWNPMPWLGQVYPCADPRLSDQNLRLLQRCESTRAEASVVRRKGPIEPMSWRPAVAEFEDSLSLIVSDAKQEARK